MEIKEVDRVVIAKPVASRPTSSSFGSFSELLAGVIDASETPANNARSEMALSAIRPKTVKVKPATYVASHNRTPDQAETSGAVQCSSDKVANCQNQSTIVFKPLAKIVSKATVSLLATMGNTNIDHQETQFQTNACDQLTDHEKFHLTSNQQLSSVPQVELSPGIGHQMLEKEQKVSAPSLANADQLSSDGYNWRKYGQKQVKGSEYPRSYYKCTHPNCPVKKKVERSLDGQIAEIVYRGEHNHIKTHPLKRGYSGVQGQGLPDDGTGQDYHSSSPMLADNIYERNETTEGKLENQNDATISKQSTLPGNSSMLCKNPVDTRKHSTAVMIPEDSAIFSAEYEGGAKVLEADNNEPKIKRRKPDDKNNEAAASDDGVQEQRVWVQNNTEPEVMGDGFRWRKYGQKVVKGNPHPRSYYRCTSLKCNVRKHVERALDDPTAFITTYEGRHNHEKPMKNANHASASEPDIRTPTTTEKES